MARIVAQFVTAIIGLLGLVHLYWAIGRHTVSAAVVPEVDGRRAFSPSRPATFAVAIALFLAAVLVAKTGRMLTDSPAPRYIRVPTILLGLLFIARAIGDFRLVGFFKRKSLSRFARLDSIAYSPLCLALGLGILYVVFIPA